MLTQCSLAILNFNIILLEESVPNNVLSFNLDSNVKVAIRVTACTGTWVDNGYAHFLSHSENVLETSLFDHLAQLPKSTLKHRFSENGTEAFETNLSGVSC